MAATRRRAFLALSAASAAILAIGAGSIAGLQPGIEQSQLTTNGRAVLEAAGRAILEGTLPAGEDHGRAAVAEMLGRVDRMVFALPPHTQSELSQLLSLLSSGVGRRTIAGLAEPWHLASVAEIQAALRSMRLSTIDLRLQAYQAIHEIVSSAYFSESTTWSVLNYPGPRKIRGPQ
jgi:hypothetical protein